MLTAPHNNFEYSSFAAVSVALRDNSPAVAGADHFLMLHDTMLAGPQFWQTFAELRDIVKFHDFRCETALSGDAGCVSFSIDVCGKRWYLRHASSAIDFAPTEPSAIYRSDASWRPTPMGDTVALQAVDPDGHFWGVSGRLLTIAHAPRLLTSPAADKGSLQAAVRAYLGKASWRPLCNNFNVGVASAGFLRDKCGVFGQKKISKTEAIRIEHAGGAWLFTHPLSLRTLDPLWRYARETSHEKHDFDKSHAVDVYKTGVRRSRSQVPVLDLVKTLVYVDMIKADAEHPHTP